MKFKIPNNKSLVLHKDAQAVIDALMRVCHIHSNFLYYPENSNDKDDYYLIEIARVTAEALGKTKTADSLQELLDFMSKHGGAEVDND